MPWLPVAIESVLAQTFDNFEFLLIDDGSKNGCSEVLDDYEARDSRIRVIRKENGGQVSGLNRGIAEARGEYIARLDADDMMYPERLAKQIACLDAHPDVVLVGSQVDWAGTTGTTKWTTPTESLLARWTLIFENCFMGGGVTFRTETVRAVGGYDPDFNITEDYDLWDRLAVDHGVVNLPETLVWFNNLRTTNGSMLHAARQESLAITISARAVRRYVPEAADEAICDLYHTTRMKAWSRSIPLAERPLRLARAARLLIRLRDTFLKQHEEARDARRGIEADVHHRLMRIRFSLSERGGVGQLARLHRPRWDRNAYFLRLPALLTPR